MEGGYGEVLGCGCHAEKHGFTAECVESPGRASGRRVTAVARRIGQGATQTGARDTAQAAVVEMGSSQRSPDKASSWTELLAAPGTWQ